MTDALRALVGFALCAVPAALIGAGIAAALVLAWLRRAAVRALFPGVPHRPLAQFERPEDLTRRAQR